MTRQQGLTQPKGNTLLEGKAVRQTHVLKSDQQLNKWISSVGGFDGSGGSERVRLQRVSTPHPTPCTKKFSPDFYVLHGPHWAAQGGPDPRPATPLVWTLNYDHWSCIIMSMIWNVQSVLQPCPRTPAVACESSEESSSLASEEARSWSAVFFAALRHQTFQKSSECIQHSNSCVTASHFSAREFFQQPACRPLGAKILLTKLRARMIFAINQRFTNRSYTTVFYTMWISVLTVRMSKIHKQKLQCSTQCEYQCWRCGCQIFRLQNSQQ